MTELTDYATRKLMEYMDEAAALLEKQLDAGVVKKRNLSLRRHVSISAKAGDRTYEVTLEDLGRIPGVYVNVTPQEFDGLEVDLKVDVAMRLCWVPINEQAQPFLTDAEVEQHTVEVTWRDVKELAAAQLDGAEPKPAGRMIPVMEEQLAKRGLGGQDVVGESRVTSVDLSELGERHGFDGSSEPREPDEAKPEGRMIPVPALQEQLAKRGLDFDGLTPVEEYEVDLDAPTAEGDGQ